MLNRIREETVRPRGIAAVALVLALTALGGCASSRAAEPPPASHTAEQQPASHTSAQQPASATAATASRAEDAGHAHGQQAGMMEMCPMRVPGTTPSVSDTEGGVAVVFKTTGDVTELRRRVHHMVEMHSHHHAEGTAACCGGMMGSGRHAHTPPEQGGPGTMRGMSHERMVPATAAADDVDGGARMVLTPKDPSQLGALRAHVHEHSDRMSRGECPMRMKDGTSKPSEQQDER